MKLQQYVIENPQQIWVTAGTGGLLGWFIGKSVAGAVLGAAIVPVAFGLVMVKVLDSVGTKTGGA